MTPLKDTLEVVNPAAENSGAAGGERSKSDTGGLRSDAVSLEVPVKVHGSRVTEVVRGITPHTEPFEEQTSTMIVFPQGGVLRMNTTVTTGQMVVLTNLKSGHDAICRVVKVRACAQSQSYVEVEFTNRQQGYWGVRFANDAAAPVRTILPPPPPPVVSTAVEFQSETSAPRANVVLPQHAKRPETPSFTSSARRPAAPLQHVLHPQKKESSFVGIGSQEDVQPAASAMTLKTKIERPAAQAASLSMTELRGDSTVAPPISTSLGAGVPGEVTDLSDDLAETSQGSAPGATTFATGSTSPTSTAYVAPQKVFGARFDSIAPAGSEQAGDAPAGSGKNWFLIATGIAALLVAAIGGASYFHVLPGAKPGARTESAPPAMNLPATSATSSTAPVTTASAANSVSGPAAQIAQATSSPATAPASAGVAVRTTGATPVSANRAIVTERVQPAAPVNQQTAKTARDMSATLTAHPVSSQRSATNDAEPAPSVDAGSSTAGELQGISSASDLAPPPAPAAPAVKRGGDVHPPKLVSSAMPLYPSMARSTGVEGSVVILASINEAGIVVATKVLSGPPLLRQAAVNAVRHWKYQPATLNGSPVPVDITVTMAFHN